MALHEMLNSAACTVLLVAMLPLATIADIRRRPAHTLLMLAAELAFFLQIITPFSAGVLPPAAWQVALLTTVQAVCVLVFRRRLWQFARHELAEREAQHPMRRVSDLAPDTRAPQGQQ